MMVEAVGLSDETTQRCIPEDYNLRTEFNFPFTCTQCTEMACPEITHRPIVIYVKCRIWPDCRPKLILNFRRLIEGENVLHIRRVECTKQFINAMKYKYALKIAE
jgi:hypothetical protein